MRKLCLQMHLVVWVLSKKCLQMIAESLLVYKSQLDLEYIIEIASNERNHDWSLRCLS